MKCRAPGGFKTSQGLSRICKGEVGLRRKRARAKRNVHRCLGRLKQAGACCFTLPWSRQFTAQELLYLSLRHLPCWPYYSLLYSKSSSLVYSPGPGYYVSMSPFPLLAPLDILPFTTTSFPPLCSKTVCWFPASLSIDPKGPSLKASHRA